MKNHWLPNEWRLHHHEASVQIMEDGARAYLKVTYLKVAVVTWDEDGLNIKHYRSFHFTVNDERQVSAEIPVIYETNELDKIAVDAYPTALKHAEIMFRKLGYIA